MSNSKQFDHNLQKAKRQHRAKRYDWVEYGEKYKFKLTAFNIWNEKQTFNFFLESNDIERAYRHSIEVCNLKWWTFSEVKPQ